MFKKEDISKSLISIFIVIGIFIISLYSLDKYINNKIEEQVKISMEDISSQNIKLIQNEITNKFNLLSDLSKWFTDYTEDEISESYKLTKDFSDKFHFREIGIALPNGLAYMSTDTIFDVSERDYFNHSIKGENYVSNTLIDMRDKKEVNVYSVPVKDESDNVKAVILAIYDRSEFVNLLKVSSFEGNGYSYIIDSNGNIITDSPKLGDCNDENLFDVLRNSSESSKDIDINNKAIENITSGIKNNNKGYVLYNYNGSKYAMYEYLGVNDWWLVTVVPQEIIIDRISPITNSVHIITTIVTIFAILTVFYIINKDKKMKKHLINIAYKDSFTGLYNKNYIKENIFTKNIKEKEYKTALVIFNINNFKMINEIYGMNAGDCIIKKIANILNDNKENKDEIVSHSNGDEFLALYFYKNKNNLNERLIKIENKINKISYNGNKICTKLYVGIYEINNSENNFEKIYTYANIAKNKSRLSNSNFYTYYNEELAKEEISERKLEDEIKEGILKKEFKAWFQPKFDCKTKKIVGCEALARWYKEDGKVYFPNEFIEISEKNGLIKEIDKLIFEDVCVNIKRWQTKGINFMPVSINISRIYLNNIDVIYDLKEILNKYGISTEYIQLEITESSLVSNEKILNNLINEMHRYGFKVLLDDFGVGYSSLSSINMLNFDILKIDKSFTDAIGNSNGNYILKYTIDLGKKLGMEVVVEGVETKEQYEFLKENGCNTIQGYYFSKPLNSKMFEELLLNEIK